MKNFIFIFIVFLKLQIYYLETKKKWFYLSIFCYRPVPIPAPLVVEDPPSSDNVTSEEETTVRHNIDPVLLNGLV